MRIGVAAARRYYTNSGVPAELIKYPQTVDPCCHPFYMGQNVPNFGPNFDFSRLRTAVFLNRGALSENKKQICQGPMIGLPSYQTWGGWVPPTPRTVGAMGTPKGKSEKFLIYPPFQRPTPSTPPPILYHLLWP